jgi:hypothetical protein
MANLMPGMPTVFDGALYRPAGLRIVKSSTSVRLDWVDGEHAQVWMTPGLRLALMMLSYPLLVHVPTHLLVHWLVEKRTPREAV